MIKNILSVLFALILFNACKKSSSTPAPVPSAPSTLSLLTGKQWIYDEIYHDFNGTSGTLIYKRGASANTENWDAGRVIYWSNGLADEWGPSGNYIQGFWQLNNLNNNDSSLMHYTNNIGINAFSKIMTLDDSHYVWYDTVNLVEGKMISK